MNDELFSAAIAANVPVLFWGAPGVGKTARLVQFAAETGRHLEVVSGAIREPSDYLGMPIETGGRVRYAPPAWAERLAAAPAGLLFLDELTTGAPSVQKAMLRIIQERYVGELALPDTVAIVAAANPPEIAADGWDLPAPLANRLCHMDYQLDVDRWLSGLSSDFLESGLGKSTPSRTNRKAAVIGAVAGFVSSHRSMLLDVPKDPSVAGRAWPSPRSWTNATSILAMLPANRDDLDMLALKGCVGEAAAIEYMAWLAAADLYDPFAVLKSPSIVDWDSRPDRIFALLSSILSVAVGNLDAHWAAAVNVHTACATAGHPDLAWNGMSKLLAQAPPKAKVPPAAARAFSEIMVKMGRWAA